MIGLFMMNSSWGYAEIYRWTDEKGKVHYGDQPFGQKKAEKVAVKLQTPIAPDPELEAYRTEVREQLQIADEKRLAKTVNGDQGTDTAKLRERCSQAQHSLNVSLRSSGHFDTDQDGQRTYLSSEQIEQYRENLRTFIARNCH